MEHNKGCYDDNTLTKSIHTLVPDIQLLLTQTGWFSEDMAKEFGHATAEEVRRQFSREETPSLRLSKMGPICPKALWHSIHTPGEKEALQPWASNKFAIGHMLEQYAIALIKAAGHKVEGEQHECKLLGIKGHIDCLVDGCLVDIKSCSSRQFIKYKTGSILQDDPFGHLDQLDGYHTALLEDPIIRETLTDDEHAYIFAIEKQMGHMVLYEHSVRPGGIRQRIAERKHLVGRVDPPECACGTVVHGASGNVKLDTRASYSAYKWTCFPRLRCFLYADGPVYLTKVVRKPDVREVDRYGKTVYS